MKINSVIPSFSLKRLCKDYSLIFLATFVALVIGRVLEVGLVLYYHSAGLLDYHYFLYALLDDLKIGLLSSAILLFIWTGYKGFYQVRPLSITATIITIVSTVNTLLIVYFSATLVPLGPEFWAYSIREMSNTVLASEFLNTWIILFFTFGTLVVFLIARYILKLELNNLKTSNLIGVLSSSILISVIPPLWVGQNPQPHASNFQDNKFGYFILSSLEVSYDILESPTQLDLDREYPFLRKASERNVLKPFFKDISDPPNIVFIIVESLGGEFVGPQGKWAGFAPNLDSLARNGLYWENGISLSGRTFGVMPSLIGSLPYGNNGFMELGPNYPNHNTLASLLDRQGYHTSFFSGFNTYFDKLDFFLEYQGIDFVLNKQKIEYDFKKGSSKRGENYWGYDDKTMLQVASGILDTTKNYPRLDIFHTLQSHSPFTVPDPEVYEESFNKLIDKMSISESMKASYHKYRSELTTLMYTDEAIGEFMESFRKRSHYSNTIFIITGDHWLIPIPQSSQISRYHVPIIIFSPLLKEPVNFKSINTHANIVPSLTSLLEQNVSLSFPDSVHWLGAPMDTSRIFRNIHSMPLMKNKNQISDYVDKDFYLSGSQLYKIDDNLSLVPSNDTNKKNQLLEQLHIFKAKNQYAVQNDKITRDTTFLLNSSRYTFITEYDTLFHRIDSLKLTSDEQFQKARDLAFNGKYNLARAVAKRLLLANPDYLDVQLLVGRTHSWEGNYEQARKVFTAVIERSPEYDDSYNALFDANYWHGNLDAALKAADDGLKYHPYHASLLEKKIRVLVKLQNTTQAQKTLMVLLKNHPDYNTLSELKSLVFK